MLIKLPIDSIKRTLSRSSILTYMKDTIPNSSVDEKEEWSHKRCVECSYQSGDQPLMTEHHLPPMKCYNEVKKPCLTNRQLQFLCPHTHIDDVHAFICRHSWRMKTKQKCHYMIYDGVLPSFNKKCDPYLDINFFYRKEDWKQTNLFGPGIATPMSFLSTMLSQFCWHKEDAGLLSVNMIVLPPDYNHNKPRIAKIWFIIPMRHADTFWNLMKKRNGKTPWSKDGWWLPPLKIIKECEMKLFVQHEGEMILTGPFAPHCGINAYPSHAESVNTMFPHAAPAWFKECHNEQLKLFQLITDEENPKDDVQKKINIAYQACSQSLLAANLDEFEFAIASSKN